MLDRVKVDEYDYNWKTFIEVYLEDYHVDSVPPRPRQFRRLRQLPRGLRRATDSVQVVPAKNGLGAPGTPVYRKWHEACLQQPRAARRPSTARSG